MKRKRIVAVALLLLCTILPGSVFSADGQNSYRLVVNNTEVSSDAKVIDGKTYIPLEEVSQALNAKVQTDSRNNTILMTTAEYTIPDIVKKVSPSVAGIIGKVKNTGSNYDSSADNLMFGTGIIYKSNGYIITNAHVVKDMEKIVVVLSNSKAYSARLKAIDEQFDLALIKIDKGFLTPAVFGDINEVEVGQTVIAIGTPMSFSLRNSATEGIISGMNRSAESEYRFIQSDVAINGGNSGGPLVNMKGEVIGINSVKYVGYGVEGLSFSIPVDTVKYVINHFEKYGKVKRAFLGADFSESLTAKYGLPTSEGLTITGITPDSPAESAGLAENDKLIDIDGTQVHTIVDYNELMKNFLPNDSALLKIRRNGKEIQVKVIFSDNE